MSADEILDVATPTDNELNPPADPEISLGEGKGTTEVEGKSDALLEGDDLNLVDLTKVGKENDWEFEQRLADYFNANVKFFIPTKVLKERILDECPPPKNLCLLPKLDKAMNSVIPEAHSALKECDALGDVWEMIRNISAPQMFLWQEVENLKRLARSAKADATANDSPEGEWKDFEGESKDFHIESILRQISDLLQQ